MLKKHSILLHITILRFSIISIPKNHLTVFKHSINQAQTLRYGENPHQQGVFYGDLDEMFTKLNGKELSYNNLVM